MLEVLFYGVSVLAWTGVVLAAAGGALELGGRALGALAARRDRARTLARLPDVARRAAEAPRGKWFGKWEGYVKAGAGGLNVPSLALFFAAVFLVVAGLAAGVAVLRNPGMTLAACVLLACLPFQVLGWTSYRREQKINDQLSAAIGLFSVEFEVTRSVREALAAAARGTGQPLRGLLERCVRRLAAGKSESEALGELAANLGTRYGRLWCQMMLAAVEDSTVVRLMPRLSTRLAAQRLLAQKNLAEIGAQRRIGILLNALVLPGFVFTTTVFPEASRFFVDDPLGRVAVLGVVLSVVVGVALDRILGRVEL